MRIRRFAAAALLAAAVLGTSATARAAAPVAAVRAPDAEGQLRIDPADRCPVCRMFPARNAKLAAAIELSDGRAFYPCGPGCLLEALEHPETHLGAGRSELRRVLVQEYLSGRPIDAASAFFVPGSDVSGPMGPAPIPLATEADATAFRASHGGQAPFRLPRHPELVEGPESNPSGPSWHPLLLLILALHACGLALLVVVAAGAVRRLAGSSAASPAGAGPNAGRAATVLLALASLALVGAVASTSKALVPGAMCGTGVLQAMGGEGGKALALQALALLTLSASWTLDSLRRKRPDSKLAESSARLSLLSLAVQGVASLGVLRAILALDPHRPVDCCSLVYGRAAATQAASPRLEGAPLLSLAVGLALLVLALAIGALWRPASKAVVGLAVAALAFVPLGGLALLRVVSAHWSPPLANECPWCLFLPEHGRIGYPLLGALAVAGWEAVSVIAARAAGRSEPGLAELGTSRVRSAALRVGLAMVGFVLLAAWPLA
ncbi:MAG TPA: nitrous oxide reductase accessory protein NosL [Myxococcales bacterium]